MKPQSTTVPSDALVRINSFGHSFISLKRSFATLAAAVCTLAVCSAPSAQAQVNPGLKYTRLQFAQTTPEQGIREGSTVTLSVQVQYQEYLTRKWKPLDYLARTGSPATVRFNLGTFTQTSKIDAGGWARVSYTVPVTAKKSRYLLSWNSSFSGDKDHRSTYGSGGNSKFTVNK